MKKSLLPSLVLVLTCFLFGCKKEETNTPIQTKEGTLNVNDFSKIDVDGDIILNIHYSSQSNGEIKIKSNSYKWTDVVVKSENGELLIIVKDGVTLTDSIWLDIYVPILTSIRLENHQHAIIHCDTSLKFNSLDIVTEAESLLEIYQLNATSVTSKQEADSKVILTGSDSLITTASFRGEGKSTIEISKLAVKALDIILQGESKANVWAINSISGKGEGQSVLNYYGNPNINYPLTGTAQIVKNP